MSVSISDTLNNITNGMSMASAIPTPWTKIVGAIGTLGTLGLGIGQNIWQGFLNNKQMQREDNSLQRKMLDAQLAGINPLIAVSGVTGAGASAGTVGTTPQISNDFYNSLTDSENMRLARMQYNNSVAELKLKSLQLRQSIQEWKDMGFQREALRNQYANNAFGSKYEYLYDNPTRGSWQMALYDLGRKYLDSHPIDVSPDFGGRVNVPGQPDKVGFPTSSNVSGYLTSSKEKQDIKDKLENLYKTQPSVAERQLQAQLNNLESEGVYFEFDSKKNRTVLHRPGYSDLIYKHVKLGKLEQWKQLVDLNYINN